MKKKALIRFLRISAFTEKVVKTELLTTGTLMMQY